MRATDGVGPREVVLEIVTPFVRDHVVVELLRVIAIHAEQEQLAATVVVRRRQVTRSNVFVARRRACNSLVVDAPEGIQRREGCRRIFVSDEQHRAVNGIKDGKRRRNTRVGVTAAAPPGLREQIARLIRRTAVEHARVHDVDGALLQRWRIGAGVHVVADLDIPGQCAAAQ